MHFNFCKFGSMVFVVSKLYHLEVTSAAQKQNQASFDKSFAILSFEQDSKTFSYKRLVKIQGIYSVTTDFLRTYNCDLLVLGPEFAILSTPLPVWVRFGLNSSLNGFPQMDSPPVPVAVGSPPCSWWAKYNMQHSTNYTCSCCVYSRKICKLLPMKLDLLPCLFAMCMLTLKVLNFWKFT